EKGAVRSLQRALVTFSRQKVTPRGERGQAIEKQSIARDACREINLKSRGFFASLRMTARVRFFASLRMTGGCSE
ncbi:MAG: hypothetical protein LBN02_01820, partial [Oscillospiraceae bacterium]|nr:hypothetical protein [Oscillospiraceae bacterium]